MFWSNNYCLSNQIQTSWLPLPVLPTLS